jgi:hypothetical protein
MPGRRRAQVEPDVVTPNALVASAARMDLSKKPKGAVQADWQAEAWDFYDTCGELRYAANWMGNSLSRATIYAADVDADGQPTGTPTTNPRALAAAHDLLGGPSNQAQILQQVGVHLTIAGDAYIIGETPVDQQGIPLPDDEWYVASTDELSFRTGGWFIDRGNGRRPLAEDRTVIIRCGTPTPARNGRPTPRSARSSPSSANSASCSACPGSRWTPASPAPACSSSPSGCSSPSRRWTPGSPTPAPTRSC